MKHVQNTWNPAQEASKILTVKSADTWMLYIVVLGWQQSVTTELVSLLSVSKIYNPNNLLILLLSFCVCEDHMRGYVLSTSNYYVLWTVHLSIILGNDQLDTQLLYFTTRILWSSTCFEHYMLIIRRLNCIDAASGSLRSLSTCAPDSYSLRVTIPDAASIQFKLLMMSI